MSITKQDTFQIEAKTQNFKQLGLTQGSHLGQIISKINTDLDFPLKLSASFPTPDSKINFSDSAPTTPEGATKIIPPVQGQIFTDLSSLWIDFQAQTVSNPSDFEITWPTSNTVGYYRIAAFKLSDTGLILIDFSDESQYDESLPGGAVETFLTTESGDITTTESGDIIILESTGSGGGLANPGSLFSASSSPIGYVVLQCTHSDGKFKTSGSSSDIIENSKIFRFDCRAQSSISGSGEANTASNVGSGADIFKQKTGTNLEFKSLVTGANVNIISGSDTMSIVTPSGEVNTASNVGSGTGIFKQKTGTNLEFKSLVAGSNVTINPGSNVVTINSINKEVNTASNVGSGTGIFKQKTGTNLEFKSLVAGSGVTITPSTSSIVLSALISGENNTASNVGSGTGIFKQKTGANLEFKTLTTSSNFFTKYSSDNNSIIIAKVGYYKLGDIVESALTYAAFQASRTDGNTWVPLDGRSIVGSDLKNTYPYISSTLPVIARKFIKINYT